MSQPLIKEQTYHAPVEEVWAALTDKAQMKQWYFDVDDFEPRPGFEFSFTGQNEGTTFLHRCRVIDVIPLRRLSYTWRYEGYPGESIVSFELFPEGDHTRLVLTHAGLDTFPQDDPNFARNNFSEGWNHITGKSLKEYLE